MANKYDRIGKDYDATRCADPYLCSRLLDLLQPEMGSQYLDLGCGTGNYNAAMAKSGVAIVGVEPSEMMLQKARSRHPEGVWISGTAEAIPFPDAAFAGIVATLTMHHWANLDHAFAEIGRVLKSGGRVVVFTSSPSQMKGYWLNHYFPGMLAASIAQMPSVEAVSSAAKKAGLDLVASEKYHVADDLQDCFLYVGKNKPELYLDPKIRRGISSFAALANQSEVDAGLRQLESDVASGAFIKIQSKYKNRLGDYLFIVFEKTAI